MTAGGLKARLLRVVSDSSSLPEQIKEVVPVPVPLPLPVLAADDNADLLAELGRLMEQPEPGTATPSKPAVLSTVVAQTIPPGVFKPMVGRTPTDGINLINARHFIAPASGEMSIYREGIDAETGFRTLSVVSLNSMRVEFAPYTVDVPTSAGTKAVPAFEVWLRSQKRREFLGGIILQPEGTTPLGCYNLFDDFALTPKAGDASPMIDHAIMLCSGDVALVDYLLNYLALCVQRPGSRPEVAMVLKGGRGTGKGTLFRVMLMIFGRHGLHLTQPKHLVGNFNSHLRTGLFVFADECHWPGDKASEGVLKGLITEPTLAIEMKGRDVFTAPNRIKLVMASNNDWVVPAGADERRYCVIDVSSGRAQDHAYFATLNAWIDSGGAEIFLDHLLARDLSGFNVRAVPKTAALDRQKIEGMPALDRWILEALDTGVGLSGSDWNDDAQRVVCDSAVMRLDAYCRRAATRGARADSRGIGRRLGEVFGIGPATVGRLDGTGRARSWSLPGIAEARAMAAVAFGLAQYEWGAA